jgi:hypothetical protein
LIGAGGMAQVVENLLSKWESLNSNPIPQKKKLTYPYMLIKMAKIKE